jgi:Na+/H+-dicarboxylate symporter
MIFENHVFQIIIAMVLGVAIGWFARKDFYK